MDRTEIDINSVFDVIQSEAFRLHPAVTPDNERRPLVCQRDLRQSMDELSEAEILYGGACRAMRSAQLRIVRDRFPRTDPCSFDDWEAVSELVPAEIKDAHRRAECRYEGELESVDGALRALVCGAIVEALGLAGVTSRAVQIGIARAVIHGGPAVPLEKDVCPHCGNPTDADALRCGICRRYFA